MPPSARRWRPCCFGCPPCLVCFVISQRPRAFLLSCVVLSASCAEPARAPGRSPPPRDAALRPTLPSCAPLLRQLRMPLLAVGPSPALQLAVRRRLPFHMVATSSSSSLSTSRSAPAPAYSCSRGCWPERALSASDFASDLCLPLSYATSGASSLCRRSPGVCCIGVISDTLSELPWFARAPRSSVLGFGIGLIAAAPLFSLFAASRALLFHILRRCRRKPA